ncbi:sugar phosphate isomerase/epimerase family protein [Frondihabitans australicus]|uniref:Sugar phosphate isomerase/epimerase n=1 Tax=Frondihabitans australicus TaxID=386892 RepID=A0A495IGZ4_9MICO|nr:sugar phosphate isomerase/epimerase [Frondihabitans australicus]RKR75283.1 sugar phosphate isomerase/epimerase [Frondihabitans australicus]
MAFPAISVQLYSVYREIDKDLDGTLARLAEIGLKHVEAFDFVSRADALKKSFAAHGLTAPTGHAILIEEEVDTPDKLLSIPPVEETFAAAAALGLEVVIDPYLAPARWATADSVKWGAERLNERAEQAAAFGLKVGYHNHDHEFRNVIDGRPAYELFVENLEPSVKLEVDLYWASAAGIDIVKLLPRLGERVVAVHAKDGPMRDGISTAELPTDQKPAGQGGVRLAEAIASAPAVKFAVIEYDHFEGDIFDGVQQSFQWLSEQAASTETVSA